MNIYAEQGHKVIVTTETINSGYDSDKELANKHLKIGAVYTVEYTNVGGWHTTVYIKEMPNIAFNSVNFEDFTEN